MNDRLDHVRRRMMRSLDERAAKAVKKRRFTILRNGEDLDAKGLKALEALRAASQELSDAYALKEELRRIYRTAGTPFDAMCALRHWFGMAKASGIPEMAAIISFVGPARRAARRRQASAARRGRPPTAFRDMVECAASPAGLRAERGNGDDVDAVGARVGLRSAGHDQEQVEPAEGH